MPQTRQQKNESKARKKRALIEAIKSDADTPDVLVLAKQLHVSAGGTQAVADEIWRMYTEAKDNSLFKNKILSIMLHLWSYATPKGNEADRSKQMTEEELDHEIDKSLAKVAQTLPNEEVNLLRQRVAELEMQLGFVNVDDIEYVI